MRGEKSANSVASKDRVMGRVQVRGGRGLARVQRGITNRHEGLGVDAGLGHPNGIDSEDPHLIQDALDHPGGLVGGLRKDLEVQLHPAMRALFLPLHEVPWTPPSREEQVVMERVQRGHRSAGAVRITSEVHMAQGGLKPRILG